MLEELFNREVMPEGKNNYVLSGQAKVLLALCKVVDEMKAAQQSRAVDRVKVCAECGQPAYHHDPSRFVHYKPPRK